MVEIGKKEGREGEGGKKEGRRGRENGRKKGRTVYLQLTVV